MYRRVHNLLPLKGTVRRDFRLQVFFMNQFPKPLSIQLELFQFFFKNSWRYSRLKVHHWCRWHQWQMEKIFNQDSLIFLHLLVVELTNRSFFSFKFTLRCQQSDIVPIICHWYQQHQWYRRQNFPPVTLIPVVHRDLRISPQFFANF
jgi:hypothetical protein